MTVVSNLPLVSINIPTLNSSATLEHCLRAIRNQTYKNIEIIVVDSFSSDSTVEIATKYGAEVFFARGLLNQRQEGIRRSKGTYIFLVDSDQVLERTAVENCVVTEASLPEPEAIILNEISVPMMEGHIAELQAEYVRFIHTGDWDPLLGTALPRFFPAKALKEIPPVAHEIGYFDHAFMYKHVTEKGIGVRFSPKAVIHHYERNIPLRMLRKFHKYYGFYIIPALVVDRKLVFGRVLPRRALLRATGDNLSVVTQLFLYGAKALATSTGTLRYILSDMFNTARNALNSMRSTLKHAK